MNLETSVQCQSLQKHEVRRLDMILCYSNKLSKQQQTQLNHFMHQLHSLLSPISTRRPLTGVPLILGWK